MDAGKPDMGQGYGAGRYLNGMGDMQSQGLMPWDYQVPTAPQPQAPMPMPMQQAQAPAPSAMTFVPGAGLLPSAAISSANQGAGIFNMNRQADWPSFGKMRSLLGTGR